MAAAAIAVIINCGTRESSALALASTVVHGKLPVRLIDCESTDGRVDLFAAMQARFPHTLERWPLRAHGAALDALFSAVDADFVLLVDSDAEIVSPCLVPAMRAALADERAYGSGFLHAGQWLGVDHRVPDYVGYYAPRMWIPCVMLRVSAVRSCLQQGATFRHSIQGNEIPGWPLLSTLLAARFRVPLLRRSRLDWLFRWRPERFGERPHFVHFDTGARVHERLLTEHGMTFAHLGEARWAATVRHYHGVTRRQLRRRMRNCARPDATLDEVRRRLAEHYGIDV